MTGLRAFLCYFLLPFCFVAAIDADIDFVETEMLKNQKQIHIPGYPFAFNPSIVRWHGRLIMSFRDLYDACLSSEFDSAGRSWIGLVFLDEDFTPISTPQILNLQGNSEVASRAEDPRLIVIGEKLYMLYSDNLDECLTKGGYRMHVAELSYDGEHFCLESIERLSDFDGENPERREKNWVPFDFHGQLQLAYSINPHKILRPIRGQGCCELISSTQQSLDWKWGELRGGTPGVQIDGDRYLAFFHSSKSIASPLPYCQPMLHYFMGAYTFSASPPFEVLEISPCPVAARSFYDGNIYTPYWRPLNVVFPGGILVDNEHVWIFFGKHDHEIWVAQFDKQKLLESLICALQ